MPSITNANDAKLISLIGAAKRRVLLLAPGTSEPVARALAFAWERLGGSAISVILDVDPEVCRLGYGTLEALRTLRDAAAKARTLVCHQPGVRIGLLIADDTTIIFSPTPLLVEAGSTQPCRPNAIQLGSPPEDVVRDVGLGNNPTVERTVGLDPVRPAKVDAVARNLANCPPVKFDLARQVRVFTTRFQFVELEMTGCRLSSRRVRIPTRLMGLAQSGDMEEQFHAQFNLVHRGRLGVQRGNGTLTERDLDERKLSICRDFLILLKGYGWVVLRANKEKLEEAVEKLRGEVCAFKDGVQGQLQKHIDKNVETLVEALLPAVKHNPPNSYTKMHGPGVPENQLRLLLKEDIEAAFGKAEDLVQEMLVKLVFKDVAIESLQDKAFLSVASAAMPGIKLHEEFDAAKTADDSKKHA